MSAPTRALAALATSVIACSPSPPSVTPPAGSSEPRTTSITADTRLCTSFSGGTTPPGEGAIIARVLARGPIPPEAEKRGTVCELLRTRAGARLDTTIVESDVRELWRTGLFDDVRVTREPAGEGIVVTYELAAREEIARVTLQGVPASVSTSDLDFLLPSAGLHDPKADFDAEHGMIGALRDLGYRRASASHRLDRAPATGTTLVFTIEPGAPTTIDALKFAGLVILDEKKILAGLVTRVGEPIRDAAVERDGLVIAAAGYDEGLLQIHVGDPVIADTADGARVTVTFPVEEGPQFRIGTVKFVGDLHGTSDEYVKRARIPKKGEVFRRRDLVAAFGNITAFHASSGETVTVDPEVDLDAKTRVVDITAHVTLMRP